MYLIVKFHKQVKWRLIGDITITSVKEVKLMVEIELSELIKSCGPYANEQFRAELTLNVAVM